MLLAGEVFLNFFENVLLAGEILKKFKMLKRGEPCLCIDALCTNMVPPCLTF